MPMTLAEKKFVIAALNEANQWAVAYCSEYERGMCQNPEMVRAQIDETSVHVKNAIKLINALP